MVLIVNVTVPAKISPAEGVYVVIKEFAFPNDPALGLHTAGEPEAERFIGNSVEHTI